MLHPLLDRHAARGRLRLPRSNALGLALNDQLSEGSFPLHAPPICGMDEDQVKALGVRSWGEISSELRGLNTKARTPACRRRARRPAAFMDLRYEMLHRSRVTKRQAHTRIDTDVRECARSAACELHDARCFGKHSRTGAHASRSPKKKIPADARRTLTAACQQEYRDDPMAKMYQLGIRADARTRARWVRKAKIAGMSLNKWAMLVLDSAPEAKPSIVYFDSAKDVR